MVELLRCPRFRPRRAALLMASALCLLTAVSPAGAAAGPKEDLVIGTGQGLFPTEFGTFSAHVHVNARGDETDARGHTRVRTDTPIGEVLVDGSVFCVNADGNQATVGVVVERSNFFTPGTARLRKVVDNGQGRHDPPDQTGATAFVPPPATCPPPAVTPIPTGPVDQGNFEVKDGA
jgi:hypothetical protein